MGIRVEPPDVNVSAVQFTVAGDTIRFGLAAIKNVGEAAMQSILTSRRAQGDFGTLEDFCARVDLRLVNRRVVESLIKAGAFDSLGLTRAHLLATTDAALESGQRQQRDQAEGQGSFFELLPAPPARPGGPVAEVMPGWYADQRLGFEKEVLGFYISGHPLARFRGVVETLGITTSGDLAAKGHGARVILFGHPTGLKETSTKSGNRMAFFTLEDMDGTVDITVFPEPFKAVGPGLHSREALLVRGRVDDGEKGRVVLAEDIRLLEQALAESSGRPRNGGAAPEPNACRIRVAPGEDASASLAVVRQLCEAHPGRVPVFLHLLLDAQEVAVRARGLSVAGSPGPVGEGQTARAAAAAGLARFEGQGVVVIGHQKGRDTREKIARNFGMPHPEGYRKALRLMHMAQKFDKPVLTFIDTPGAYPGLGAEERGQAEAIARNLRAMAGLRTPILTVVTGEGGSGGALAIGMGNRVLMLEYAIYSVISPEGCAAIAWGDASKAPEAAESMRITAPDLLKFGVIDAIVPEPVGGAHRDWEGAAGTSSSVPSTFMNRPATAPRTASTLALPPAIATT